MDMNDESAVQAEGHPHVYTVIVHDKRLLFLIEHYDEKTGKLLNTIYSEYLTPEIARKLAGELNEKANKAERGG